MLKVRAMTNQDQKNAYLQSKWDESNSTYCQVIHFENGKSLQGYSKRVGFNEKNDKVALLTNWILRSMKIGYLDPNNPDKSEIICIEYYQNEIDGQNMFLRLYYNYYELAELQMENKKLIRFLDAFYQMINDNIATSIICDKLHVKARAYKDNPLSIETHRYRDPMQLLRHCQRISNTIDPRDVLNFFHEYMSKFFIERFQKEDFRKWISHAKDVLIKK